MAGIFIPASPLGNAERDLREHLKPCLRCGGPVQMETRRDPGGRYPTLRVCWTCCGAEVNCNFELAQIQMFGIDGQATANDVNAAFKRHWAKVGLPPKPIPTGPNPFEFWDDTPFRSDLPPGIFKGFDFPVPVPDPKPVKPAPETYELPTDIEGIPPVKGPILHLDCETASACDLKKAGVHLYARHPSTRLWCVAYAFDDDEPDIWIPGVVLPQRVVEHIKSGGAVWAHNAVFEQELINNVGAKHGWPMLATRQLTCTMALAHSMALPGALDKAAAAVGMKIRKDTEGHRVMMKLAKPIAYIFGPNHKEDWEFHSRGNDEHRPLFAKLDAYCIQDVEVERGLGKNLLGLIPFERRVWALDQKVNALGVGLDIPAITKAVDLIESEGERLHAEMRKVTDGAVASCSAIGQLKDWIKSHGIDVDKLAKSDVTELLEDDGLPTNVRAALLLRREAGKSSNAKLIAMLARADAKHRARGLFQFAGAGTTGRWAGRSIQLHNLPRPKLKPREIERIIQVIRDRPTDQARDFIELTYGNTMQVISDCLRGFIVAGPGNELAAFDFAAIEARVLAWLAGEEKSLKRFESGEDVYVSLAAEMFKVPKDKVTDNQRQIAKVCILACGYQGSTGAFQTMGRAYGVKVSNDDAKRYVEMFREANPKIVHYWEALERAARNAVLEPGKKFGAGGGGHADRQVTFLVKGSFLMCKLPSGRCLFYAYPKVMNLKTPWGMFKDTVTYKAVKSEHNSQAVNMDEEAVIETAPAVPGAWTRIKTYGGKLAENITQAVSRDLLAAAMLRINDQGYNIVMHVHDEVVIEAPEKTIDVPALEKLIAETPDWARGLPIAAKGWVGKRYRK